LQRLVVGLECFRLVWSGVDSVRDDIDRSEVIWRVGVRTMYRLVPVSIGLIGVLAVCSVL